MAGIRQGKNDRVDRLGGLVGWLSSMSSQLHRVASEQCVGGKIGRR